MKLFRYSLLVPAWSSFTAAHQPGAAVPDPAPLRDLEFGDLNFLHTTDTHGWHAGHLLEGSFSADWGDYISFTTRLREKLEQDGKDLIVIDTGDRVEGNGLYDASDPRGKYTFDIFKEQEIDVLCSGNHELYKNSSAEDDYRKLVPAYKGNYLASNLCIYDPDTGDLVQLAPRSRVFTTKKTGIRILAFGFIYDFTRNDRNTYVIPVGTAVKQSWFTKTIHDADVDLIVVAGHVALQSYEFGLIHKAIRSIKSDVPIQFFGGHYHIRDYRIFDERAHAIASGRFMETIGFQSISNIKTNSSNKNISFFRRYIDNNLFSLQHHTNTTPEAFHTSLGHNASASIAQARAELKLDQTFGCAPQDYWMSRAPYPHPDSVFTLLTDEVFPDIINPRRQNKTRIIIANTGAIRFDIFKGAFTRDSTYIVSPFTSDLQFIKDVPYGLAKQILPILNRGEPQVLELTQLANPTKKWKFDLSVLPPPEQQSINAVKETSAGRDSKIHHIESTNIISNNKPIQRPLQHSLQAGQPDDNPHQFPLTPGYTTTDALGHEGDDTIHSPITFYEVPNCIQAIFPNSTSKTIPDNLSTTSTNANADAEPVDLLFNAFLQPYILALLNVLPELPTLGDHSADASRPPLCVQDGRCEDMLFEESVESYKQGLAKEVDLEQEVNGLVDRFERRKYSKDDVENYVPGETFTSIFAGWIKENWAKNCPEGTKFV